MFVCLLSLLLVLVLVCVLLLAVLLVVFLFLLFVLVLLGFLLVLFGCGCCRRCCLWFGLGVPLRSHSLGCRRAAAHGGARGAATDGT